MLYICAKFPEIISNGIKVIERTRFLYGKLQREMIPQKCRWTDHCQSLHIVWSCFIFLPSFVNLSQTISKLLSGHDFYTENYKEVNSAKNVGGVTVVSLCTSSGHAYIYATFREIIWNGIKMMVRTRMMNR